MKKVLITIFIVLIYVKISFAYSYLGIDYGDIVGYYGTRNLGIGGTGIASADDYSAFLLNPATGFNFDKKVGIALSCSYFGGNERVMDYETPVSYESSFDKFKFNSFGIYSRPVELVSVGFAMHPVFDQNYESEHYIPETTVDKNGVKYIQSKGSIDSYSFGLSVNIKKYGALGFSFSILKGSQKLTQGEDYYESAGLPDSVSINEYEASGNSINLGIFISTIKNIYIGGFLRTGISIDITGDAEYTLEIPSQMGAGILIKSLFGYDTTFAFDFIYKNWEDFKRKNSTGEVTPSGFYNTYELHSGVEHILVFGKTRVPVRFGYYFQPFYGNDAYDKTVFTLGTGLWEYPYQGMKFDFGLEFGKRNYLGDNAYFDETKFIDETLLNFVLEVGYEI